MTYIDDGLSIPGFLRRSPGQVRALNDVSRRRRRKPRRPEGDVWGSAELMELHFNDECAPISSGRRFVWVVEGRKWVRFCTLDGTKTKVGRRVLEELRRRQP